MNRLLRALLPVALLVLWLPTVAGLAPADSPDPGQPAVGPAEEQTAPAAPARWVLDPELQASRDAYARDLAALTERFAAAKSQEEALAIQREIEALKVGAELAVLEIQARRARERGDEALALQIEDMVTQVRAAAPAAAPAAPSAPAPAPAPGR